MPEVEDQPFDSKKDEIDPPAALVLLLAASCGLIVANLYYAQPLIELIAPDVGLSRAAESLIVTLTQLGYCLGLMLLVPLGDLVENRALTVLTISGAALALLGECLAPSPAWLLAGALGIGMGSASAQMLVPIAAHLAPDASRGRVVGNVMSGLLAGIMLARPVASLLAHAFGWRAVFAGSAVLMVLLALVLRRLLPRRRPHSSHSYPALIGSLFVLLRRSPILRRRSIYQTAAFATFSLFWTAVPLELSAAPYHYTQRGIALFAFVGAAGALAAPIAGRLADLGWGRAGTGAALVGMIVAFLVGSRGADGSMLSLVVTAVLLDFAVQSNMVFSQRAIYSEAAHARSRMTGIFIAIIFVGGAVGSAIASSAFLAGGWTLICRLGAIAPLAALVAYATEFVPAGRLSRAGSGS